MDSETASGVFGDGIGTVPGIELRVGPYVIRNEVGRGGQGTVFAAQDTRLHRTVAIKILTNIDPTSTEALLRFKREAEITSGLEHPGICPIYDADLNDAVPFVVMRFVEGEPLAERIHRAREHGPESCRSNGPPVMPVSRNEVERMVRFIEKVARALHAAHEAGVVHRDVKPGNLMVTPAGDPLILDFGLALVVKGEARRPTNDSGMIHGSPYYMSPEQVLGEEENLDRRTDVFSLGSTLYECLTLRLPFESTNQDELFQAIVTRPHPSPRLHNAELPKDLEAVVNMALAKDPGRRYQTALDFAADLCAIAEGRPVRARRSMFALGRTRIHHAAALFAALTIVGMAGFVAGSWNSSPPSVAPERPSAAIETAIEEGFRALDGGLVAAGRAAFERALLLDAECAEAVAGLAVAAIQAGMPSNAIELLDRNPTLEARLPALRRLRVEALLVAGRPLEAVMIDEQIAPSEEEFDLFVAAQRMMLQARRSGDPDSFASAVDLLTRAALLASEPRALYHQQRIRAAEAAADEAAATQSRKVLDTHWPVRAP